MNNSSVYSAPNGAPARIQTLPAWLVNKIAAGEVIERPASCVKELIENAIDAGATDIQITISQGGKKLIRVTDNGQGILANDLPLIFKSHSTSKLIKENDLYNINTFGFRGEALASMASIAKVRLISKTTAHPDAYEISIDNGQTTASRPVAGVDGTTMEITDIFYQTPARRKFLKSDGVELSHINETITRFAIAYPEISFKLINIPDIPSTPDSPASDKKFLINITASNDDFSSAILQRLMFFYGSDTSKTLLYAAEEKDNLKLNIYFSDPTQTRSNSKLQFFYLNRRFIRDRILSRAIYQAYHNLIPSGRYPFVTLFIQMPANAFDVNVHPAKMEVRFRDAWKIHDQIVSLIRGSLAGRPELAITQTGKTTDSQQGIIESSSLRPEIPEKHRAMQALVDFFAHKSDTPQETISPSSYFTEYNHNVTITSNPANEKTPCPVTDLRTNLTGRTFQIHNSYIIEEVPDGILIIDQHALHERLLYNRFSHQVASSEIYRQKFLIPTIVEVPKSKSMILPEIIPYLKKVGIEAEEFGANTLAIQSAPSLLNKVNFNEFILGFIDAFTDDASSNEPSDGNNIKPIDNLIKLMACKAAIKAGDPLSQEEIKALLADAKDMDFITCPHGRPAIRKITLSELEDYFQR